MFLKNLYIELLECPKLSNELEYIRDSTEKMRARKEEWVDISKEIEWEFRRDSSSGTGVLTMRYKENLIGHMYGSGEFFLVFENKYKIESSESGSLFKVLKKEYK